MPQWRNKITLKDLLTDDESNEAIVALVDKIIPQLQFIHAKETRILNGDIDKEAGEKKASGVDEYLLEQLEEVINNFKFLKDVCGENENPEEYSFDNWTEAFNSYLAELYDLGDIVINNARSFFDSEKFLWVA